MNTSIIRRRRLPHGVAAMTVKTLLGFATPDAFARPGAEISPASGTPNALSYSQFFLNLTPNERKQKHARIH
jgi:hypothetical protein